MTAARVDAGGVVIVILNWNRRDDTLACLDSLARADLGGARVIVVDNGSRDGSLEAVRSRFPAHQLVALPHNLGYAAGNNAGIRVALEAGATGVLLLNNDTQVSSDFLAPLLDAINSSPQAGAVSAAIHRLDRPEMLDVAFSDVNFDRRDAVQLRGVNKLPSDGFEKRQEVRVAVGCCLLVRADVFSAVGLFDEAYFAYHEDVDWCLRVWKAGYQIFYEPLSRVFHRGSASTVALRTRPRWPGASPAAEQLPNAEAMPFNPVRTYLGARNLVRLLRTYASEEQRRHFVARCRHDLPLEFAAAVLGREGWVRLGRLGYRDLPRVYLLERHAALRPWRGTAAQRLLLGALAPIDLLWCLPRDVVRAVWVGRTAEWFAYVRGLWDGWRGRPLPARRLGLE